MLGFSLIPLLLASVVSAEDALKPPYTLAPREHDVAVVIGVEKYSEPGIPASDYSADDARAFKDSLVALGFRETNIQLLTDDAATGGGLRKTIERWLPAHVKPDSTVVFYYSGHGAPDVTTNVQKPEAYLLPADGDPNYLVDTGYKVETLYDKLGKLQAKQVVVVLDACFSGQGEHSVIAKGARALVNQFSEPVGAVKQHMAILTATKASQMSASDPSVKHGVLTYNLLKAVADGKTDLYDIYTKIKAKVEDQAKGARQIDQSPQFLTPVQKPGGVFLLADAKAIETAKAEWAKAHDETAKKAAEAEALKKQKEAIEQERARVAEEARQERERLAREHAEAQRKLEQERYEQQRRLDAEREELNRRRRDAPSGEATFVPPTF